MRSYIVFVSTTSLVIFSYVTGILHSYFRENLLYNLTMRLHQTFRF